MKIRADLTSGANLGRWPVAGQNAGLWAWRDVLSFRQGGQHINAQELRAVLAAVKWRIRHLRETRTIVIHLIDSQVCMAALARGRSSSRILNGILRRINALKLASGLSYAFAFVRSADNPADAPSRRVQRPVKKKSLKRP